jgi:raffinose/stachyose/melibiose transport system permease protein
MKRNHILESLQPYLFLTPALLFFCLFVIYPVIKTVIISFYDYGLTDRTQVFIGINNYIELAKDSVFWISLKNNVLLLIGSLIFQVGMGLMLAAMLNRGIKHGSTVYRTIFFAPVMMSFVAVALLWYLVYDPNMGALNQLLKLFALHGPKQGWLGDPHIVIYAILGVACWQYTGFIMVILLAGMQSIPHEINESSLLDGANEIQNFFYVTIPCIRNVIIVASLVTMIGAFKVFDLVYVMTNGGPGRASQVLGVYVYYEAFMLRRAGYASAIAVVLLFFAIILGALQLRFSRTVIQ